MEKIKQYYPSKQQCMDLIAVAWISSWCSSDPGFAEIGVERAFEKGVPITVELWPTNKCRMKSDDYICHLNKDSAWGYIYGTKMAERIAYES